jgi:rhomboid protease GluP
MSAMSEIACPHCTAPVRTAGLERGWSVRCAACQTVWNYVPETDGGRAMLIRVSEYQGPRPGDNEWQIGRKVRTWLQGVEGVVTPALIAINITVFGAMCIAGVDAWRPDGMDLVRWQGLFAPAIHEGQYHRLLTSVFVHVGAMHLCVNALSLYWLGTELERQIGPLRFLLVYLLAGVGGSINALYFTPHGVVAGASGAIFGLAGAMLALLRVNRLRLMSSVAAAMRRTIVVNIVVNLALGFGLGFVSNSGHIGGLVTGFAVGLGLCVLRLRRPVLTGREVAATAAALAVLGGLAVAVGRREPVHRLQNPESLTDYVGAVSEGTAALYDFAVRIGVAYDRRPGAEDPAALRREIDTVLDARLDRIRFLSPGGPFDEVDQAWVRAAAATRRYADLALVHQAATDQVTAARQAAVQMTGAVSDANLRALKGNRSSR